MGVNGMSAKAAWSVFLFLLILGSLLLVAESQGVTTTEIRNFVGSAFRKVGQLVTG